MEYSPGGSSGWRRWFLGFGSCDLVLRIWFFGFGICFLGPEFAMSSTSHPQLPDPTAASRDPSAKPTLTRIDQPTQKSNPGSAPGGARNEAIFTLGQALAGTKFGDIELLEEIGRGGMGVVYKGKQLSLDRLVAVKMLLAEHFENPVVFQRFLSEARAVAALDHRDIVKIYQVGECEYGHYLVMEFIDGKSLDAYIAKGPVVVQAAVSLSVSLAKAIDHAHSKGIIHRDLKPANVMIKKDSRPVVMDFGIAKRVDSSSAVTHEGHVVGTPSFMSPEQASEGNLPIGPASDVYSLGAILYAMLTGRAPFEEKTALSTILKVLSPDPPPTVRSLRPEVPEVVDRICMKCLAKRQEERYPSARALAEALRGYKDGTGDPRSATNLHAAGSQSVILVVKASGKQVRLTAPVTVIGRASECDLILRSSDISKRHCQILLEDGFAVVEDLRSANGTFVNGKQINRQRLRDGDRLDIAAHSFGIRLPKK